MQLMPILLLVVQQLTVMGTPAEEGGNGKQYLIDAGAFDDVSCSLMAPPCKVQRGKEALVGQSTVCICYQKLHALFVIANLTNMLFES